jgi:hypothetical protein
MGRFWQKKSCRDQGNDAEMGTGVTNTAISGFWGIHEFLGWAGQFRGPCPAPD